MSTIFPVLVLQQLQQQQLAKAEPQRPSKPADSNPSDAPKPQSQEQRALDTFVKISAASHGGDEAAAKKAESNAKWAKAADDFMKDELRHPISGMF
jgi:hypothetical protein